MGAFSVNFDLFFGDFFVIFDFVNVEWSDKIYDIFSTASSNRGAERPDTDVRRGVTSVRSFRRNRGEPFGCFVAGSAGYCSFGYRLGIHLTLEENRKKKISQEQAPNATCTLICT